MVEGIGNIEQVRAISEQVGDAFYNRFKREREQAEASAPGVLKWLGGIAATVFAAFVVAAGIWLVGSVGDMKVTLARMDERLGGDRAAQEARFSEVERRVVKLETYPHHPGQGVI